MNLLVSFIFHILLILAINIKLPKPSLDIKSSKIAEEFKVIKATSISEKDLFAEVQRQNKMDLDQKKAMKDASSKLASLEKKQKQISKKIANSETKLTETEQAIKDNSKKSKLIAKKLSKEQEQLKETKLSRYKAEIKALIIANSNLPELSGQDPAIRLQLSSLGELIAEPKIVVSTGSLMLDHAYLNGIYRSLPFPMPDEAELTKEFQDLEINFNR